MATRFAFLYPKRTTHLVMVNPIGLTDGRAGRGFRPFDGEVDVEPNLQAAYEADVRTELSRYVVWRPEYLEHLRIRHGVRLSAEWPRLAYVRELGGNLRSIDSTVNDWPHIQTKSMVLGGQEDGPSFPEDARRAAKTLPNAKLVLIPGVGHNPHEEVPDIVNAELIRFLFVRSGRARGGGPPVNGFAPLIEGFLAFALTMLALTTAVSAIVGALHHLRRRHARGLRDMVRVLYARDLTPLVDGASEAGTNELEEELARPPVGVIAAMREALRGLKEASPCRTR